jgi:hypothetical protein
MFEGGRLRVFVDGVEWLGRLDGGRMVEFQRDISIEVQQVLSRLILRRILIRCVGSAIPHTLFTRRSSKNRTFAATKPKISRNDH